MSKKFDVVIGNPPYQNEAKGSSGRDEPIYHLFMDAAYEMADKAVLITPARFLFDAGQTPKPWNRKMLSDPHLSVPIYEPDSKKVFPGPDIKGGIAISYRDATKAGDPIRTFTAFPELNSILQKVTAAREQSLAEVVSSSSAHRYTELMHSENPQASALMSKTSQFKVNTNAFEQLGFLFLDSPPSDGGEYIKVLGLLKNKRFFRWVKSGYIEGPPSMRTFKVVVAAANGSGDFGETLSSPLVLEPLVATTQSFVTIGSFPNSTEATACLSYIRTKFARGLLGVLKSTQHNPAAKWKHVPLQDFTNASEIDWSKSIAEIDQQLYAKYGLEQSEIDFIESHVKPME